MTIAQEIEDILRKNLNIIHLKLTDLSDRHIGHTGHDGRGESHFKLLVVADDFLGLSRVQRHQKIYDLLSEYMKNQIHALAIEAKISAEFQEKSTKDRFFIIF